MIAFGPHVDGYHDVSDQMIDDLRRRAETHFRRQEQEREAITSIADFEDRRKRIRDHFLTAIGGLPTDRTPLNVQNRGSIQRDGFRIEKLIYESVPNFYVTAALYVPDGITEPQPAVVFVHGHADNGKSYQTYQAVCVDLASNGFVVMAIDPLGQGERFQYLDTDTGERIIGGCTTDHTHAGMQFTVAGASIGRHFIWDVVRGIDYLETRPEVDATKIGITGNSGGGTQTSLLLMSEPRLAAAVPCTFIMTLESYMKTGQAQDSEQIVPGCFAHGPDHDDYITMIAPKPVLVGAVAYDFFPIEGAHEAVRRAKEVYKLYGAEDCVDIAVADSRHAYHPKLREACVNWFKVHFRGEEPTFRTGDPETLADDALWATPHGQILREYPNSLTAHHLNALRVGEETPPAPSLNTVTEQLDHTARMRATITEHLPVEGDRTRTIYARITDERVVDGFACEKVFFYSEPDIVVTGVFIHPPEGVAPTRTDIVLFDGGTSEMSERREWLEERLNAGVQLFVFDVRGVGAVAMRAFNRGGAPYTGPFKLGCDAMMLGLSTTGMRVFDVLRAFDYLRTRDDVDEIGVVGFHRGAFYAYYAAALEQGIVRAEFNDMLYSYRNLVETRYYDRERYHLDVLPYGALKYFDLVDLIPCFGSRPTVFNDPCDATGRTLTDDEFDTAFHQVARERGYVDE